MLQQIMLPIQLRLLDTYYTIILNDFCASVLIFSLSQFADWLNLYEVYLKSTDYYLLISDCWAVYQITAPEIGGVEF